MSSVVNNKVASAFPSGAAMSSSFNSLTSIQQLPPNILVQVQNAFSEAIRWAYVALIPFVSLAAIGSFFLREVKIKKSSEEEAERQAQLAKDDPELGQVSKKEGEVLPDSSANENSTGESTRSHRPRVKVYGPVMGIVWCCQWIGDKTGWRT